MSDNKATSAAAAATATTQLTAGDSDSESSIRRRLLQGPGFSVSTYAGSGEYGSNDATQFTSTLSTPHELMVASNGDLYWYVCLAL